MRNDREKHSRQREQTAWQKQEGDLNIFQELRTGQESGHKSTQAQVSVISDNTGLFLLLVRTNQAFGGWSFAQLFKTQAPCCPLRSPWSGPLYPLHAAKSKKKKCLGGHVGAKARDGVGHLHSYPIDWSSKICSCLTTEGREMVCSHACGRTVTGWENTQRVRRDRSRVVQGHGNQGEKCDVHAERMRSHSRTFLTCLFRSYSVRMGS